MNDRMFVVRPESYEAYSHQSSNLHVRQRLESNGQYSYKVSTVNNWWAYVKMIFRSLFACCATSTNHFYGLDACRRIARNEELENRVNDVSISSLASIKERENNSKNHVLDDLIKTLCLHKFDYKQISLQLQKAADCFQLKDQELSKHTFKNAMEKVLGSRVYYINASGDAQFPSKDFEDPCRLDKKLFAYKDTKGVQYDIVNASKDEKKVHLFAVASQYNCAESSNASTPKIGCAMEHSKIEITQGPKAQRTNPVAFELVTAFLTHLGFNMMDKALPSFIGKTYETEVGKKRIYEETTILHGYLIPSNFTFNDPEEKKEKATQNLQKVVSHLKANLSSFETVCYSSIPSGGKYPTYLILAAAPSIPGPLHPQKEVEELQYYAALANFTTQFKQLSQLAEENPKKKIVLHVTLPGSGVFGNNPTCISKAFKNAALNFQQKLSQEQKDRLLVQLDIYDSSNNASQVLRELDLT